MNRSSASLDAEPARYARSLDGALLELSSFGLSIGSKRLLKDIDLTLPHFGVTALIGPVASGKSALLKVLAGDPAMKGIAHLQGHVHYDSKPLACNHHPTMVAKKRPPVRRSVLRHLMNGVDDSTLDRKIDVLLRMFERRDFRRVARWLDRPMNELRQAEWVRVALLRAMLPDPPLLCLDEATVGLDARELDDLLGWIEHEKERRSILFVSHHQGVVKRIADRVVLLAGGRIIEDAPVVTFFDAPRQATTRHFIETGSCSVPSIASRLRELASEYREDDQKIPYRAVDRAIVADSRGPQGFRWLIDGVLGGTPRPGIIASLDRDLEALACVGTTLLVSLIEDRPLQANDLARHGLSGRWYPMPDMGVPDLDRTIEFCRRIDCIINNGGVVVYHCHAGLGRTGLMLAAQLIYAGMTALRALEHARQRKPQWVQSEAQEQFLWDLELRCGLLDTAEPVP
jgi:atypical dual specificity phosphatase